MSTISPNQPLQSIHNNNQQNNTINQATLSSTSTASTSSASAASSSNANESLVASNGTSMIPAQTNNSSSNTCNKHWSQNIHESTLSSRLVDSDQFLSCINGGSDNGQFIYFDSSLNNIELSFLNGKLNSNEILLEIQNQKISGYTLYDVVKLLKQLSSNFESINFRTVEYNISKNNNSSLNSANASNLIILPIELRTYLDERFQKNSIDYDLQQTIRENVYMRTVPCTTRAPRNGEIDGQDYIFLTNDQFLELEQNGDLLEYGVYNEHYYGTPKPPKEPIKQRLTQQECKNNYIKNYHPKRNISITDMNSISNMKNTSIINQETDIVGEYNHNQENDDKIELNKDNQNSIKKNSEKLSENIMIEKDDYNKNSNANRNEASEILPYGWEKVDDPEYGTFYIDHINKQTTYENPYKYQSNIIINSNNENNLENNNSLKTFKPTNTQLRNHQSNNNTEYQFSNSNDNNENNSSINNCNKNARRNIFFTQNPLELKGEFLKTSLLKTPHGFGFTIIGANETSEDFLQIKYIVPDGAAYKDGKLRQGDVLVYVNNECVLGYTHQDVVEIFQSIAVGNYVDLTICRGYPLSIDPNDPNIEIMPLAAIINPNNKIQQAPLAVVDELTASTLMNSTSSNSNIKQPFIQPHNQTQLANEYDEYYCEEYEEMYAPIIKGQKGFGFTIADDSQMNQQKVKQILDKERCINLNENDILLEINGIDLRYLTHNQVVDVLKECQKGKETIIKLKRRKYQIILPQVPNSSTLNVNNLTKNHTRFSNGNQSNSIISNTLVDNFENVKLSSSNEQIQSNEKLNSNLANEKNEDGISSNMKVILDSDQRISNDKKFENTQQNNNEYQYNSTLKQNNLSNNQNQLLIQDNIYNSNQIAFNKERRSKTPNILQSSSNNTNILNDNLSLQLRSKTPTTDRILFQNSLNDNDFIDDYVYLNNNIKTNYNNNPKEFNSSSNKSNKSIYQMDHTDKLPLHNNNNNNNTNNNNMNISENTLNKSHIPIYDSTTNIQHQRVLKNLNKFNNLNNKSNDMNQLSNNRSKTPGPETIYFRNSNNQYSKSATISAATSSNIQNSYINRSKTPTADIMYYPSSKYNNLNVMFDNIYQPFDINKQQTNYISDYNSDEAFMNLLQSSNRNEILSHQKFHGGFNNNQVSISSDVDGNHYLELTTELHRQESGFGFRIVGGEEEGSQVAIGFIVQGGAAHLDNVLRPNDEIIMIDNECVLGATHRRVVQLMTIAGLNRKVKLMVRRKITNQQYQLFQNYNNQRNQQDQIKPQQKHIRNSNIINANNISPNSSSLNGININGVMYPYTITLFRNGSEGFGFVIISTLNKNGPSIGKIVENSPAERCKRLNVGDRILAVNGINITQMNHLEIVKLIKESGNSITLTIGAPMIDDIQVSQANLNQSAPSLSVSSSYLMNSNNAMTSQNCIKPYFNMPCVSPNLNNSPKSKNQTIINQNEYHVIELRKHQSNGFGFSIRGGREFNIPLFVLKLADQGPAALDGRLQVGDQILEINGYDAYNMSHNEAIERIKSSGNIVTLLIRRTGQPPPTIDQIIAANSSVQCINQTISNQNGNINNEHFINHQSQLRAKSPFLTQHVKQFNSSGALINRNY